MNAREKFDINIPIESLTSTTSFKEFLDDMKHRFDVHIKDEKNDEEISKLRKIIASAIVATLYNEFPDAPEHKTYQFDGAYCGSRQVKHKLLTEALNHEIFQPRKYEQLYGWINTAASFYSYPSSSDISKLRTASQNVIYKVLQANQEVMNAISSAQYQVEAYKQTNTPSFNK
jgi:hypothetical protein